MEKSRSKRARERKAATEAARAERQGLEIRDLKAGTGGEKKPRAREKGARKQHLAAGFQLPFKSSRQKPLAYAFASDVLTSVNTVARVLAIPCVADTSASVIIAISKAYSTRS